MNHSTRVREWRLIVCNPSQFLLLCTHRRDTFIWVSPNTLQHTATHCNTLQHTASHWITLQTLHHTAIHCITLHHTATHCNTLQHTATDCITLHHTASHCTTLQHTATHCNTLQHTATILHYSFRCQHTDMTHSYGFVTHIYESRGSFMCDMDHFEPFRCKHTFIWVRDSCMQEPRIIYVSYMDHVCDMNHFDSFCCKHTFTGSWLMYKSAMNHARMSPVTQMINKAHLEYASWLYEWVMSHTWMNHGTRIRESRHTLFWIIAVWMCHATHTNSVNTQTWQVQIYIYIHVYIHMHTCVKTDI